MPNHATKHDLTLFHFPGACSTVTLTAMEEIGLEYKDVLIDILSNEQHGSYKDINPGGKVPALVVDGALLTENAAILIWLHNTYPGGALLPAASTTLDAARQYADLMWAASTWHPIVRSIRMPSRLTDGDEGPIRARGLHLIAPLLDRLERTFGRHAFYYGSDWSIVDVYLHWLYTTARSGGVDLAAYPAINRHCAAIEDGRSFQAAKAREAAAVSRRRKADGKNH